MGKRCSEWTLVFARYTRADGRAVFVDDPWPLFEKHAVGRARLEMDAGRCSRGSKSFASTNKGGLHRPRVPALLGVQERAQK